MSKKYDMSTRAGRARRHGNYVQFNPDTLLPHSREFIAARNNAKRRGR